MGMAAMWPGPFEQQFVPPFQGGSTWNLASVSQKVSHQKLFEIVENAMTLDKSQWITFGTHKSSYTYIADYIYQVVFSWLQ